MPDPGLQASIALRESVTGRIVQDDRRRGEETKLRFWGEGATILMIGAMAALAHRTGIVFLLFPELAALAYGVFLQAGERWAEVPGRLFLTPFLTAVIGVLLVRSLGDGLISSFLSVGLSLVIIRLLRSPVSPAISAGLLPLVLKDGNWQYPAAVGVGTGLLAILLLLRRIVPSGRLPEGAGVAVIREEERLWESGGFLFFLGFFGLFLAFSDMAGGRMMLVPPLVVAGYELFSRSRDCPWASRPIALVTCCVLVACVGVAGCITLGKGALAAVVTMAAGMTVFRGLGLALPPALAIGLLPFFLDSPGWSYPAAVGAGAGILSLLALVYRRYGHWGEASR